MQTITLNPKVMFWGFGNVNLNFSNPGPVNVNFAALSLADKKVVCLSYMNGKIEVSDELKKEITSFQNPVVPQPTSVKENLKIGTIPFNDYLLRQEQTKQTCESILGGKTIGSIIKNILSTDDVRKLQLMLKLEKESKKRSKIIDTLQQKLSDLTTTFPKEDPTLAIDKETSEIEESEIKVVEISVPKGG